MKKEFFINIVQLVLLSYLAYTITNVVMKICYVLYPIALKFCGSKPEEIYNFGVDDGMFWMLASAIAFFIITILENRYAFMRKLSNAYALLLVLIIAVLMCELVYELVLQA